MKYRVIILLVSIFCMSFSLQGKKREKRSVVRIETSEGIIRVALSDDTPVHRDNFLKLSSEGFYDGTLFHRCIQDFMIQGGDPDSRGAAPGAVLGEGDTGYTLLPDIQLPYLYHVRGALAAARDPDDVNPEKRSSGCQFYIVWGKKFSDTSIREKRELLKSRGYEMTGKMVDDYIMKGGTPHLDGEYTVFGEVIEGLKVVRAIQLAPTDANDRPREDIVIQHMEVEQLSEAAQKSRQAK